MKKKQVLLDIARSLAVLAGRDLHQKAVLTDANAYQWDGQNQTLLPIEHVNYVELDLLLGIDSQKSILSSNTEQFARGLGRMRALVIDDLHAGRDPIHRAEMFDPGADDMDPAQDISHPCLCHHDGLPVNRIYDGREKFP